MKTSRELMSQCLAKLAAQQDTQDTWTWLNAPADFLELVAAAKAEGAAEAAAPAAPDLSDRDLVRLQRHHDRMQNAIERAMRACPNCMAHTCNAFAHDWLKAAAWPERNFPWLETKSEPQDLKPSGKPPTKFEVELPIPTDPMERFLATHPPAPGPARKRMPPDRKGKTHKFSIAGCEGYLTANLFEDGTVGEIFLRIAKQGSTLSGLVESWAVCFSMALQYGVPLDKLCEKFRGWSFDPAGFTGNEDIPKAESIVDYVSRWLLLFTGHPSMLPAENVESPEDQERAGLSATPDAEERAERLATPVTPAPVSHWLNVASHILNTVRLDSIEEEEKCASGVLESDNGIDWGDFYGPATSPYLARVIAHRFLDKQGGDPQYLVDALKIYGSKK